MTTTRTELGTDVTETSDVLPVGTVLGDYTILRVLGQGGFGVTYLAHDAGLDQDVVLKENMPAQFAGRGGGSLTVTSRGGKDGADSFAWATQRFLDEARLLATLNHPNIVRVLRAFSALGTAYYVMPWVGGRDLKHYAEEHGVDQPFLEGMLRQLLPALSYLHGNNLLHRDIKPANILCTDDGTPILIDFGTARALVSERSQTMVESAGYTPMEQIQSHGNTGPWTDLYALGATLYTLITGEHPPRSSDRIGKTDSYVSLAERAELKGRYCTGFLAGIDKALAVWPEDRWQSADEWLKTLMGDSSATLSVGPELHPMPRKDQSKSQRKSPNKIRYFLLWSVPVIAFLCGIIIAKQDLGSSNSRTEKIPSPQIPRPRPATERIERPNAPQPLPAPQDEAELWYQEGLKDEHFGRLTMATYYYRMAADQGHAKAQYRLARLYENGGQGVTRDLQEAVQWYLKAASQGNEDAKKALEDMEI